MNALSWRSGRLLGGLLLLAMTEPAWAHHVMGKKLPGTFLEGALSGLGHPIIGLDHLAAVVAVGCLAALHRSGTALVIGYLLAMVAGAAIHAQGVTVPASEALVALSVIALGAVMVWSRPVALAGALSLFFVVGLLHGYALGESIVGAERTPLVAYFVGFAAIQAAIGLAVMAAARVIVDPVARELAPVRLVGAGIAGIGIAILVLQVMPAG